MNSSAGNEKVHDQVQRVDRWKTWTWVDDNKISSVATLYKTNPERWVN